MLHLNGNEFSFGVAFVGGYNGGRGAPPGRVNLDSKSYTAAQWKSYLCIYESVLYLCTRR